MADKIFLKVGDTEPLDLTFSLVADSELSGSDLDTAVFYAREADAATNHVDGVELDDLAVSSTQRSDDNWEVTVTGTFDPVDAKKGGGNAFDAAGSYRCYTKATWTDTDISRHPGKNWITIQVQANYE